MRRIEKQILFCNKLFCGLMVISVVLIFTKQNEKSHMKKSNFTFMLPCIVIDFFLNKQPDSLIIPILFCYKTLYVVC